MCFWVLAGCEIENASTSTPSESIMGVKYEINHLGKVIVGPVIIGCDFLGVFVQKDDDTIKKFIFSNQAHFHNLFAGVVPGQALYEVWFIEPPTRNDRNDRIYHSIFFTFRPSPEQILPFIPEEMRKIETPTPEPTVIRPEKEPGQ